MPSKRKPKPKVEAVRAKPEFHSHYSGDASEAFWRVINRLDKTIPPGELWRAAVELQNLEQKVLGDIYRRLTRTKGRR